MNRRARIRTRQNQINILHTTTRKRHSQKQVMRMAVWCGLVLAMIVAVGAGLHFGIAMALDRVLYTNPRYVLTKIEIEPRNHFPERQIRLAAGLQPGQNLWTLDLRQITRDLEKLPYVSSAKVERQRNSKMKPGAHRHDHGQHETAPNRHLHHLLLRMPLARRRMQDVDLLLAGAGACPAVHAVLSFCRAAQDNSTMRRHSCGKVIPTAAAAFGSRLVAVMPGMVLISRQTGNTSSSRRKSMRE